MEKILEVDLDKKENLFECYNKKKVSKELIQYMEDSIPLLKKGDTLKVIINNNIGQKINCSQLIKSALKEACLKSDFRFHYTNLKQLSFLIIGVVALILSSVINIVVLKEIVIIGAWVLLWDVVEMEIVDDILNRKKKKILEKILSSEFIENYNCDS